MAVLNFVPAKGTRMLFCTQFLAEHLLLLLACHLLLPLQCRNPIISIPTAQTLQHYKVQPEVHLEGK